MKTNKELLFNYLENAIAGTDHYIKILSTEIEAAQRVFIIGMGRSGLVGRMFAMRLFHLGKESHMVWDTCTPPIQKDDLLIAISNSGTTASVTTIIEKAAKQLATIILVSSNLAPLVTLPPKHLMFIDVSQAHHADLFPMGTLFELSTILYFDLIVAEIIANKQINETYLQKRHANLE
jgi:6-phospho-3-hexuloisomerase